MAVAAVMLLTIGASEAGQWGRYTQTWPVDTAMVRDIEAHGGEVYMSTGGPDSHGGQIYRLDPETQRFEKRAGFHVERVMTLQSMGAELFVGMGTPHSSEGDGIGHAVWGYFDADWVWTTILADAEADLVYSQTACNGEVFAGTFSEDKPGEARVLRWDGEAVTQVGGAGVNFWPEADFSGIYEMACHGGELYVSTFSRTPGEGNLLRLRDGNWQNLGGPDDSMIGLAIKAFEGNLVVAFSARGVEGNPIRFIDADDVWHELGTAPEVWAELDAYIPNTIEVDGDVLYLGIGGQAASLGVWTYDSLHDWQQVGGNGAGWYAPLRPDTPQEWVYTSLSIPDDERICFGMAGTGPVADLWCYTPG